MNITYKSNKNIVYSCKYHVVWCPKYRRKVLTNGIDVRLKELLLSYAAELSVDILEMELGENEWLSDIQKQANRLTSLTNDLVYLSRSSRTGGYGIGLSVAKAITEAHNGKIRAKTEDGHSIQLTVSLPA